MSRTPDPRRATNRVRGASPAATARSKALRALPAVEAVLQQPALQAALAGQPRRPVVDAVRAELASERARVAGDGREPAGAEAIATRAATRVAMDARPHLRRVLNATGVVLHTNLGRAPLAREALQAIN